MTQEHAITYATRHQEFTIGLQGNGTYSIKTAKVSICKYTFFSKRCIYCTTGQETGNKRIDNTRSITCHHDLSIQLYHHTSDRSHLGPSFLVIGIVEPNHMGAKPGNAIIAKARVYLSIRHIADNLRASAAGEGAAYDDFTIPLQGGSFAYIKEKGCAIGFRFYETGIAKRKVNTIALAVCIGEGNSKKERKECFHKEVVLWVRYRTLFFCLADYCDDREEQRNDAFGRGWIW